MGHVDLAHVSYFLPDGRALLYEVSFRVGDGAKTALLGANGTGKTTLLRLIAGDLDPAEGTIVRSGGLGVMRQFIGSVRDATTVRGFLPRDVAPPASAPRPSGSTRPSGRRPDDDESAQLAYAQAIADWADVGGYDAEVLWDTCIREPRSGCRSHDAGAVRPVAHAVRRRAEAAGPRGAAARPRRGAAARRARQLPRRARQAVAGGAAAGDAARRCCSSPMTANCSPRPRERIVTVEAHAARGRTAAASPPTTRPARTASPASRSCAGAGTRSTSG